MYQPSSPPIVRDNDLQTALRWMFDELEKIAAAINEPSLDHIQLNVHNNAPGKPRQGVIYYADGTNWNPGSGEGVYGRSSGGSWVKL